jgi:hypothetical protein
MIDRLLSSLVDKLDQTKLGIHSLSTLLTGQRCLFLCLFVCVSVKKIWEKIPGLSVTQLSERIPVCLSPNCQKGYRSVCHPTVRKDTSLSVTGAWEKISGLSVTHGLSVVDMYDVSMWRKHKQTKINTYHKYLHYKMPCIVGDAAPPHTPQHCHLLLSLLGFFRHICVRSCKYFIMLCLVGDAAPPPTPPLYLCSCFHFVSDSMLVYVPAAIPSWNMCLHEAWNVLVFPGGLAGAQRRL